MFEAFGIILIMIIVIITALGVNLAGVIAPAIWIIYGIIVIISIAIGISCVKDSYDLLDAIEIIIALIAIDFVLFIIAYIIYSIGMWFRG